MEFHRANGIASYHMLFAHVPQTISVNVEPNNIKILKPLKELSSSYYILEYAKFVGLRSQRQLAQSSEKKESNFLPYQE